LFGHHDRRRGYFWVFETLENTPNSEGTIRQKFEWSANSEGDNMKEIQKLSDAELRTAEPGKLWDGGRLYLHTLPTGGGISGLQRWPT
jgi:hypothetical protein